MTLAHAYGAPEALSILVPLILFVLILRAGRKRQAAEEPPEAETAAEAPASDPPAADADAD